MRIYLSWLLIVCAVLLEIFANPFSNKGGKLSTMNTDNSYLTEMVGMLAGGYSGELPAIAADGSSRMSRREALRDILPNDPYLQREWAVLNDGSFVRSKSKPGADIQLAEAWQIEQGDSNVIVAVLDGGIKQNDPEFEGRLWKNKKEIANNGKDDDRNGYIDDLSGWDFVGQDNIPEDKQGHGTNVAGIIGAKANNGVGYAGVDWNCKLMVLKVADDHGFGTYANWADAVYYAVKNGAKVINMSLGGNSPSSKLKKAIDYAYAHNVVVVAAMMNTNSDTKYYPAAYPNVLAVGATNPDDTRATPFNWSATSGSNYGDHIDVAAPGGYIYNLSVSNGYDVCWSGTSQATPYVSGLASLIIAQNPGISVDKVREIITTTADDQVGQANEDKAGWDKYFGYGRINAYKALTYNRTSASK